MIINQLNSILNDFTPFVNPNLEEPSWTDPLSQQLANWIIETLNDPTKLDARVTLLFNKILRSPVGNEPLNNPVLFMGIRTDAGVFKPCDPQLTFELRTFNDFASSRQGQIISANHLFADRVIRLLKTTPSIQTTPSESNERALIVLNPCSTLAEQRAFNAFKFSAYMDMVETAKRTVIDELATLVLQHKTHENALLQQQSAEQTAKHARELQIRTAEHEQERKRLVEELKKANEEAVKREKTLIEQSRQQALDDQAALEALKAKNAEGLKKNEQLKAERAKYRR